MRVMIEDETGTGYPGETGGRDDGADSSAFVRMGTLAELEAKGAINRRILARWVSVFAREGRIYALEMSCKHHGANLGEGKVDGHIVTCPRHFWKYNIVTGESLTPGSPHLRHHDVRVTDGIVSVSIQPMSRRED